ncbi:MAG TPA: serine hydrolase [Bacillota bacterium]|nr:serine hydrolase [Bacillota bacterium]
MIQLKKRLIFLMMVLLILFANTINIEAAPKDLSKTAAPAADQTQRIEAYVAQQMKSLKIPGAILMIVTKNDAGIEDIYLKRFGLNQINPQCPLTEELLFPLGSHRESLTALGILRLARGQKLKLSDPVSHYLTWFQPKRRSREITIEQLLYHTSGLPFIPEGDGALANPFGGVAKVATLETPLRKRLTGIALQSEPGEKHFYSPVNYVLLALMIEKVTGETYEDYLQEKVLTPLNMRHTFPAPNLGGVSNLATGYKVEYLQPKPYVVPEKAKAGAVDGASGLWVTNATDLGNWLKANLAAQDLSTQESQRPDFYAVNQSGYFSAMGWKTPQNRRSWLFNQSSLPNYSSFIAFNSSEKLGIAVLANVNADTQFLGWSIVDILHNQKPGTTATENGYQGLDSTANIAIRVLIPFILVILGFFGIFFYNLLRKKCRYAGFSLKMAVGFFLSLLYLGGIAYSISLLPSLLFNGATWAEIQVWISSSIDRVLFLAALAVLLFYLYYILNRLFPKPDGKNIFTTVVLSIVSGFSNALIIMIINLAFNMDNSIKVYLFFFFLLGLVTYIYGQRLVRLNLINVTANMVYTKRMEIVRKILKTHFYKLEAIENGKILAALNNDTEKISGFINTAITGITSMVILCCGLVYLGMINIFGLLVALGVSLLAAASYYAAGRAANIVWEKTRDIQNVLFDFLNDMLSGFKELSLNTAKQKEFHADLEKCSGNYRDLRIWFDLTFANMFVIGELMFTMVVGVIAFLFPLFFPALDSNAIRTFVFVFFYLVGPMHGILNMIPDMIQTRTSWNRIKELLEAISALEPVVDSAGIPAVAGTPAGAEIPAISSPEFVGLPVAAEASAGVESPAILKPDSRHFLLELKDVTYQYKNEGGETFKVGPVNCRFQSGEISFITGGNGSGKSTLAKLVTGLYHPDTGEILVNGERIPPELLSRHYAAVFSDFHLFGKLYGVNFQAKAQEIQQYLQIMGIAHKLEIKDGVLSTVKLSSGQRKRLALMISFLEDRPIYLFDEWAADQDPEFRKYYYHTLLPGLKEKGKCIIAITHDDRYFDTADQLFKMELGMIVEQRSLRPLLEGTKSSRS